jgi:hypothetical protein
LSGLQGLPFDRQAPSGGLSRSDFRFQISDFRLRRSDLRFEI